MASGRRGVAGQTYGREEDTDQPTALELKGGYRRSPSAAKAAQARLASINAPAETGEKFDSIDDLIRQRTPEAIGELDTGADKALYMNALASNLSDDVLSFRRPEATREQNALLGLLGYEEQQQAIAGIPVSEFDRELQRRQQSQQQRQSFSTGDVSGASLLAQQQLGSQQQMGNIQRRLGELEPFAATNRGIATTQSGLAEQAGINNANIEMGRGIGTGNIRLGAAAPIVGSIMNNAEASGLQGIAAAQYKANTQNQLAQLAGNFAPAIGSYFSQPAQTQTITPIQQGYTNSNYTPVSVSNPLTGGYTNPNYTPVSVPQSTF